MIHAITEPIKTAIEAMPLFTTGTDTRIAGVVIPVTKTDKDGNRFTFPVSCDVDGKQCYEQGRYFDLLPNDLYRAVMYFEQLSDVNFTGFKDQKRNTMIYQTSLRLVGWLNLKKFGEANCNITDRLTLGMIKALTANVGEVDRLSGRLSIVDGNYTDAVIDVTPVRQVRQDQSVFSRYTLRETFLLYPFDYFALDFTCTFYVGRECFTEVTAGAEILC